MNKVPDRPALGPPAFENKQKSEWITKCKYISAIGSQLKDLSWIITLGNNESDDFRLWGSIVLSRGQQKQENSERSTIQIVKLFEAVTTPVNERRQG